MLKKLAFFIAISLISAVVASCGTETISDESLADSIPEEKVIDVYIISGQSNAAGYIKCDDKVLKSLWKDYNVGHPNVIYMGRSEHVYKDSATSEIVMHVNEYDKWVPARAGMGYNMDRIGPEVGMAAYLSEHYYNEETGNMAAFIKYAHGGSSLLHYSKSSFDMSGSFASPTYAASIEVDKPELNGNLYTGLINEIKTGVDSLKADGYTDINIKGVYWMQGESDKDTPDEYRKAFKIFVDDLRADIGTITGEDMSALPIMVGEISETSGSALEEKVTINKTFIKMQQSLPDEIDNLYIIPSGELQINEFVNGSSKTVAGDSWHWSTADIFEIGCMIGECITENILSSNGQ